MSEVPERGHAYGHALDGFPTLVVLAIAIGVVAVYLIAASRPRRGGEWSARRSAYWVAGVAVAAASVVGPVADAAHGDFRWHMVTHLLLGMVAPLLLVLAAPVTLALRSLELTPARRLSRLLRTSPVRMLSHPVTATILSVGGLWLLYATDLYAVAHDVPVVMALVMVHVLGSGYLFTAAMVGIDPDPHRGSAPLRLGLLALAIASHEVLAKYLYAEPRPGIPIGQAEVGAQIMSYGGDAVHLVLIVLVVASWPAVAPAVRLRRVRSAA